MAKVTVREIPPTVPAKEYTLVLNDREADALLALHGFIGGPVDSPRGVLDKIFYALGKAMHKQYHSTEAHDLVFEPKNKNRVSFNDYKTNE
jgi:hypothetical protein